MKVARLQITNFRGVATATLHFAGHTLLVGTNNVGKSTVCEALELVLGLDRLKRFPPVEEFDFYNARYLDSTQNPPASVPIEIEVVLIELSEEAANKCAGRTEFWHGAERRLLGEGEADKVDAPGVVECLRLRAIARYNPEEDEFEAKSYFCGGQVDADPKKNEVPRTVRQLFGFLYLRALRTGSRALSLERGSLLDLILQRQKIRTGIWENAIKQLRELDPPIDAGAANLGPVLESIEKRLAQYVPLAGDGRATQLHVSQLTREHLRKTIAFFLKTAAGQQPVPFQEAGTGTVNALLLALLSFIAEIKKDNVIFAMEEPEIALPPHTQRRIANYLLENTTQCFVTSHSPYVLERFEPDQIQILRKDAAGALTGATPVTGTTLKGKTYRRHARRGLAEAMLGRGVVVAEGITEKDLILAAAEKMETAWPADCYPLDLAGVTVLSVDGEGSLAEFGAFFTALQIKAFAFYDAKPRKPEEKAKLLASFFHNGETKYQGAETMLVTEVPVPRLWALLEEVRASGEKPGFVPAAMPAPDKVKEIASSVLKQDKGSGYGGRLLELCAAAELPVTVVEFMKKVYAEFKRPEPIPPIEAAPPAANPAPQAAPAPAPMNPAGPPP